VLRDEPVNASLEINLSINTPAAGAIREAMMRERDRIASEAAPPARPEPPSPALRDMRDYIDEARRQIEDGVTRGIVFDREESRAAFAQRILRSNVPFYDPFDPLPQPPHQRHAAEARGVAWLKSCLSPEQLADYDRIRSFVVIGERSRNRYRICWGTSQNIIRLEIVDGREIPAERLCFGPRGVPIGDILLHQKIALEGDEQAALRIAGRTPVGLLSGANWAEGPFAQGYAAPDHHVGQRLQTVAAVEAGFQVGQRLVCDQNPSRSPPRPRAPRRRCGRSVPPAIAGCRGAAGWPAASNRGCRPPVQPVQLTRPGWDD
jgi:hypothetical protein